MAILCGAAKNSLRGTVWFREIEISQIIKDYSFLPFFLLIILWFDPSILQHSGIWGAADKALLINARKEVQKNPLKGSG